MTFPRLAIISSIAVVALQWSYQRCQAIQPEGDSEVVSWKQLQPVPDKEGFAGMYAGVAHGALIAAGGANFPDKPPWDGGRKVWFDRIYVLEKPAEQWKLADEKLPRPMAYGASATFKDAMICIGGSDADRHYADVLMLRLIDGRITIATLPKLPTPCANMCADIVQTTLYVAGGLSEPGAANGLHRFWSLDLSKPLDEFEWQELEPWPGPGRHHAVAAVQNGFFYIFSGVEPTSFSRKDQVRYLRDAYRYAPARGGMKGVWKQVADLPDPVMAAASPGMPLGKSHIAIFGGLDGSLYFVDPKTHPGFRTQILVYHAVTNTWSTRGRMPTGSSRVTLPATPWRGGHVLISGERAPGRRSPHVYWANPAHLKVSLPPADAPSR